MLETADYQTMYRILFAALTDVILISEKSQKRSMVLNLKEVGEQEERYKILFTALAEITLIAQTVQQQTEMLYMEYPEEKLTGIRDSIDNIVKLYKNSDLNQDF